jgi:hypothetical protein
MIMNAFRLPLKILQNYERVNERQKEREKEGERKVKVMAQKL